MKLRPADQHVSRFATLLRGILVAAIFSSAAAGAEETTWEEDFLRPPVEAKPWAIWYWMYATSSREGITADLEAMKRAGLGGAYLMTIKGPPEKPDTPEFNAPQLSMGWWEMIKHAFAEAKRLNLELGVQMGDGFATAGGPWVTPELSMQKLVWSTVVVEGGQQFAQPLPTPASAERGYRDLAVFAWPAESGEELSSHDLRPRVTSSEGKMDLNFLTVRGNQQTFRSEAECWIQFEFAKPFTARSVILRRSGNNVQAHRIRVEASDDGVTFRSLRQLAPSRQGWQDTAASLTHALPQTQARYFRFVWSPEGSEPGAEDLDSAKWRPVLRLQEIELLGARKVDQFESKNGQVWRQVTRHATESAPPVKAVSRSSVANLSDRLKPDGTLDWIIPPGRWTVMRIGHASTGQKNETAGAAKGLEIDKLNPVAVEFQLKRWVGELRNAARSVGAEDALRTVHLDSWEAGSQNWTPAMKEEFRRRRGYDAEPWLPVAAGVPLESAEKSERFLDDLRSTVAELVAEKFYGTVRRYADAEGLRFSSQPIAPTFVSDALLPFQHVDMPMGEYWFRSPTHDKPNDVLDAVSAARIYGKQRVSAEAFTQLRTLWDEHPGLLRTLQDRNYALGINHLAYHVFAHNPWIDRTPGMTLDGIGLYFQRDQTWWKPGRSWVEYASRTQALLQRGVPVADVAVFTGEGVPSRAVLPNELIGVLPGLLGLERVQQETARLRNDGLPMSEMPKGVRYTTNTFGIGPWGDPLRGYAYDSINRDALLRLAKVEGRRMLLPGGANYGLLVLPVRNGGVRTSDSSRGGSPELIEKVAGLIASGLPVVVEDPILAASIKARVDSASAASATAGRLIAGALEADSLKSFGMAPAVVVRSLDGKGALDLWWTQRSEGPRRLFWISNQQNAERVIEISLRSEVTGAAPRIWDAENAEVLNAQHWAAHSGRTSLPLKLLAGQSLFVTYDTISGEHATNTKERDSRGNDAPDSAIFGERAKNWREYRPIGPLLQEWQLTFPAARNRPSSETPAPIVLSKLRSWTEFEDPEIRSFSGSAVYEAGFEAPPSLQPGQRVWLNLGQVKDLAEVTINGIPCGISWFPPHRVEVTSAVAAGANRLRIEVSNTWRNRMLADRTLPIEKRTTWTNAPDRLDGESPLPGGLLGPVTLEVEETP